MNRFGAAPFTAKQALTDPMRFQCDLTYTMRKAAEMADKFSVSKWLAR